MTVVVDASVAAKWLFKENDSDKARYLLEGMERRKLSLIAPELLLVEIGSMLWKRAIREGVSVADAAAQYDRLIGLSLGLVRMAALVDRAFKLAVRHRHPIYDCVYLALAVEARCDLVTADEKFHRAVGNDFPRVRLLGDWQP